MGRKLYVGNLSYSASKEAVWAAFSSAGTVTSVEISTDRETGQSRGFAFVEMGSDAEAQAAISQMNGTMLDGRQLKVDEALTSSLAGSDGGDAGRGDARGAGGRNRR
jgi:RNA recognition motif-containing protein